MAMQRNNISCRYPRSAKARLVRWREVEGLMPGEIKRRAAAEWPSLPPIHGTTWQCWARSPEYVELRTLVCDEAQTDRPLDALWGAVQDGGMGPALQGTMYLLLRQAFDAAQGGALDSVELNRLIRSLSAAQRAEIARRAEEADTRVREMEERHAAEVARLEGAVQTLEEQAAALRELLAANGISESGQAGDEFSAAEIARAKRLYGIEEK